jgi:type III secretory pathway lipoprotein EscJ
MVMLLLYTRLISCDEALSEQNLRSEESNLSLTVLERERLNQDRLKNITEDIGNVYQIYHLERRFLL